MGRHSRGSGGELQDVAEMAKYILRQIGGVSGDDIDVMRADEITSIYHELLKEGAQETHEANKSDNPSEGGSVEEIKEELKTGKNADTERQTEKNEKIEINGVKQSPPVNLNRQPQAIDTNKFSLVCQPSSQVITEKRKLIYSVFNPTKSETLKILNDQEIVETYQNLPTINRDELSLPSTHKKQGNGPLPKEFVVYVRRAEISSEEKNEIKMKDQPNTQKLQKQKSANNSNKKGQPTPQQLLAAGTSNVHLGEIDKFSNESVHGRRNNPTSKKGETQPTIKKTLRSSKGGQNVLSQAIIGITGSHPTPTSSPRKITVFNQVEHMEQRDSQQSQTWKRASNFDDNHELSKKGSQKMLLRSFREIFLNPQSQKPDPAVIELINTIKGLIGKFEDGYLSQFGRDWVAIK